jgi:hypothetical protein
MNLLQSRSGGVPGWTFTDGVGESWLGNFNPNLKSGGVNANFDREMGQIVGAPLTISVDERQVRKFQFASLIERRNAAARKFLSSRGVMRRVLPSE